MGHRGGDDLTQNSEALRGLVVSGSEMARLIAEFDKLMDAATNAREKTFHTMNTLTIKKVFAQHVSALTNVFEKMENPFVGQSKNLAKKIPLLADQHQDRFLSQNYNYLLLKVTALFSRLYIACQTRDGNLELLFKQENHSCPPSIFSITTRQTI